MAKVAKKPAVKSVEKQTNKTDHNTVIVELKKTLQKDLSALESAYEKAIKNSVTDSEKLKGQYAKLSIKIKATKAKVKALRADVKAKPGKAIEKRLDKQIADLDALSHTEETLVTSISMLKAEKKTLEISEKKLSIMQKAANKACSEFEKKQAAVEKTKAKLKKINVKKSGKTAKNKKAVGVVVEVEQDIDVEDSTDE